MSDDMVEQLRFKWRVWATQGGCIELKAADRIEALKAALAKADDLAEAVGLQRQAQRNSVSPRTALTLTAYRQARDATR